MCGRFVIELTWAELVLLIRPAVVGIALNDLPRFNIAPTQQVPILRSEGDGRVLTCARWGLVPGWARADPGGKLINARAEGLAGKPSFREAFAARRCLLPASGFYEWLRRGRLRQPHYFSPREGSLLAFAGLWEHHRGFGLTTCTIVTVPANEDVAPLHDRMPLALPEDRWDDWLAGPAARAEGLLATPPGGLLQRRQVGAAVNSAAPEGRSLIEPAAEHASVGPLFDR